MTDFGRFFDQIIHRLGGRVAIQTLLRVGPSALSNYRQRGQIPASKLKILEAHLEQSGWQLDLTQQLLSPLSEDKQKQVLLIITGGIAAYKALELARRLMDRGYRVRGVMTKSAEQFITPLSLAALTGQKSYSTLFSLTDEAEMGHIRLARDADIVLIAPATAHFIAKMATGLADDLASTICLATNAPIYVAPAMNPQMWAHPATQHNLDILQHRQVQIIAPATGDTACGEIGKGRLAEPADIIACIDSHKQLAPSVLKGRHVLITSGPTHEPIDSVRYIANHSSGKQGHALAQACLARGARVTLVTGPVNLADPADGHVIHVTTARQMYDACMNNLPADIAICAAAVADWHVVGESQAKIKKSPAGPPQLSLAENPDILAAISTHKKRPHLVVGFAAETDHLMAHARSKLTKKGCDWIIANQVGGTGQNRVFGADDNQVSLITQSTVTDWPRMSKADVADKLITQIEEWINGTGN